ncbi:MAG: hypothetical protein CG438_912, partial [Methylococcaceae bacterium NSP1-1]
VAPALKNSLAVSRPITPPPIMVISGVLVMDVGKSKNKSQYAVMS